MDPTTSPLAARVAQCSRPVRVALAVGSVLLPVLCGIGLVLALIPLDPPDLGWGHVASHLVPSAVAAGVAAGGRATWPQGRDSRSRTVRAVLLWSATGFALAQLAEAVVAAAGAHDGTAHTAVMVLANLMALVVVASAAAAACIGVLRAVGRARRRGRHAVATAGCQAARSPVTR